MNKSNHNITFSIMKGIAIISVVVGHVFIRMDIENFVNQYHLAVFFFAAGYFFKENYISNVKNFFKKRIQSLYLPYIKLCILFALIHNFLFKAQIYDTNWSLKEICLQIYYVCIKLVPGNDPLMGAMWFCPSLLIVSLTSWFLIRILSKIKMPLNMSFFIRISIISLLVIINIIAIKTNIKSPWYIWQTIPLCGIYLAGYYFKLNKGKFTINSRIILYGLVLCLLILILFLNKLGYTAYLQPKRITQENIVFVYIISISGCFMIYLLSQSLSIVKCKLTNLIAIVGEHSFSIMALHFLAFKLISFFIIITHHYEFSKISEFPIIQTNCILWNLAYILSGVTLPVITAIFYSKIKHFLIKS